MKKLAEYVQVTDEEFEKLIDRFGRPVVKQKVKLLNEKRRKGVLPVRDGSDFQSLIRVGNQQKVQPIRSREGLEDIRSYFERRSKRDYFLFVMGINVGVRIGDLLKLQVRHVRDREYLTIREEKTGKTKRFRLNAMLRNIIDEYTADKEDTDYLFPSKKTKEPISRVQAYRIMKEAGEALGMENVGTHSLRKSFGYHFYQKNKDIAMLQDIFNHSSERVTKIYIGIAQDEIDRAMDDFFI